MKLLTKEIHKKLIENGKKQDAVRGTEDEIDFKPVVKLFTPDANCTWLLTEIDPVENDIAFGLCNLGMGFPELGNVSITELTQTRGRLGLQIERDLGFKADKTLNQYASEARQLEHIKA